MSPAVLTVLAASVVVGDPNAPILALLVVLAPLGALLVPSRDDRPAALTALIAGIAVSIVLAGSILAATDVARGLGLPGDQVLGAAVVLVLVGMLGRRVAIVPSCAVLLGVAALAGLMAAMAIGAGVLPWVVWARLASQPVLVFSATTEWVTEGRTFLKTTTLTFTETQRITAVSGGVVRVREPAPSGETVREWRLGARDSLTMRVGDLLTVTPGTRLQFEAGKRIPGLAESGVAWAAPRERPAAHVFGDALGMAVTLGGGGVALLGRAGPVSRLGAIAAPMLVLAFSLGAAWWGVYAAWLTADLAIGHSPLASLLAVLFLSVPGDAPSEVTALIALLFASLLLATAASLTGRMDGFVAGGARHHASVRVVPALVAFAAIACAAGLAFLGVEAEAVLRLGLGLGAAAWGAPRLGGAGRGMAVGTLVGGTAFVALSLATSFGLTGASAVAHYPALAAAPLGALCAVLARRPVRGRVARRPRPARIGCPEEGTLPQ